MGAVVPPRWCVVAPQCVEVELDGVIEDVHVDVQHGTGLNDLSWGARSGLP